MNDWKAEHLRITLFLGGICPSPKDIFSPIYGVEVESFSQKGFGAESIAQGTWHGVRADVRSTANRLDLFLAPQSNEGYQFDELPSWQTLLPLFVGNAADWMVKNDVAVVRAAVSTVASLVVESRDVGYQKFAEFVKPVLMRSEDFSDISFQVNIPKMTSSVPGLKMNRLSNWAVTAANFLAINPVGAPTPLEPLHSVRCMVDINTDANNLERLPPGNLSGLMTELSVQMIEILDKGVV